MKLKLHTVFPSTFADKYAYQILACLKRKRRYLKKSQLGMLAQMQGGRPVPIQ